MAKEKGELTKRVQRAMSQLKERKIKDEKIALTLDVSTSAILKWRAGTRTPKRPTIQLLQSMYGVKI